MNAQTDAADVLEMWKATYAEIFPHRNPEGMRVDDADLALAVMLRREVRAASRAMLTVPEVPTPFKLRGRILDRIASHNPKDCE